MVGAPYGAAKPTTKPAKVAESEFDALTRRKDFW